MKVERDHRITHPVNAKRGEMVFFTFGVQNLQCQCQQLIFVLMYLTTLVGLQLWLCTLSQRSIVLQEDVTQTVFNIWMPLCCKKLSQLAC